MANLKELQSKFNEVLEDDDTVMGGLLLTENQVKILFASTLAVYQEKIKEIKAMEEVLTNMGKALRIPELEDDDD